MTNKKQFIHIMDQLEEQYKLDSKNADLIEQVFPDSLLGVYDNTRLHNIVLEMLQREFDDEGKYSNIDYFIYELDFGKEWTNKSIEDHGVIIDISDSGKLYDYLMNCMKEETASYEEEKKKEYETQVDEMMKNFDNLIFKI